MKRLAGCIDRGMEGAREALTQVGHYVQDLRAVDGLLKPSDEATGEERETQFVSLWQEWEASVDPIHQQFAKVISRFAPGLFVGGEVADWLADHVDLERWFKRPKGHETLYVVRELRRKRVWFAEPLLSSATAEVRRVIALARQWAERLAKPVGVWMSDKQDAFVQAIGTEFPTTPHRYCHNHFLRDVAKPVLELDSQSKVKMRSKVRGLRTIERRVLEDRRHTVALEPAPAPRPPQADETPRVAIPEAAAPEACARRDLGVGQTANALDTPAGAVTADPDVTDEAGEVVLGYCAAVRGILNDDQGGPLHPPGVRMREALQEVRASLERNLQAQKGGVPSRG